ncbi:MAG: hypothetical protein R2730_11290 [Chitinophagales bacterium]
MKNISIKLVMLVMLFLPTITTMAQCPMCKLSAGDSDVRAGLNDGILYLLAAPFLLMGGALLWWYLNRKKYENYTNQ